MEKWLYDRKTHRGAYSAYGELKIIGFREEIFG